MRGEPAAARLHGDRRCIGHAPNAANTLRLVLRTQSRSGNAGGSFLFEPEKLLRAVDWCVLPVWGKTLALHNAPERVYFLPMIAVKAEKDRLEVPIPTEGMTAEEINDLVSWLRVETILRRSKLSEAEAWKLSEEFKAEWWQANEHRFRPQGAE